MESSNRQARLLFPIQGRWFLLLIVMPYFWLPGLDLLYIFLDPLFPNLIDNTFLDDQVYYYYLATVEALVIILLFLITKADWRGFFKPFNQRALTPALEITGFSFILSGFLVYLTFLPLSYIAPEFVTFWFVESPPILDIVDGKLPLLSNLLGFISLVVLAPVIEEVIYRGILLQRWGSKYGSTTAILMSSAIFGALHTDPFGAFVFGILMSYLLIRSNSLVLPILCHAANNLLVWVWLYVDFLAFGDYQYTLEMFQSEWVYAALFTLLSAIWFYRLAPKIPPFKGWQLPKWF